MALLAGWVSSTTACTSRDARLLAQGRCKLQLPLSEKLAANASLTWWTIRTLLQLPVSDNESDEVCVLVVNNGQGDFGLIIDKFHEGIDVIQKPLEGVMAGFNHFSGTALLGDGRVLLIINLQELLSCR